jgi:hypothetical protein
LTSHSIWRYTAPPPDNRTYFPRLWLRGQCQENFLTREPFVYQALGFGTPGEKQPSLFVPSKESSPGGDVESIRCQWRVPAHQDACVGYLRSSKATPEKILYT